MRHLGGMTLAILAGTSSAPAQAPLFGELRRMVPSAVDFATEVAFGDVDGDGDLDACVSGVGRTALYRNGGAGVFSEATSAVPAMPVDASGVGLGDLDGDGDLADLLAVYGARCRLLRNAGAGSFAMISARTASAVRAASNTGRRTRNWPRGANSAESVVAASTAWRATCDDQRASR